MNSAMTFFVGLLMVIFAALGVICTTSNRQLMGGFALVGMVGGILLIKGIMAEDN